MYVPTTPAQTTIRDPMPNASAEIKVNEQPGCPASDDLCGFKQGMRLLIFDDTGSYDVFTVTEVQSSALHLQHRDDNLSKPYDSGAYITQVANHTYYHDSATTTATRPTCRSSTMSSVSASSTTASRSRRSCASP
jgi:hypothetical protein